MISAAKLAENRGYYLERFTRFEYAGAFEKYLEECMPLFAGFEDGSADAAAAVDELMAYAAEQSKRLLRRSIELDGLRRLFALYLVPAATESGLASAGAFAQLLCDAWNAAYPKLPFTMGKYKDIAGGFRTKPFGMG